MTSTPETKPVEDSVAKINNELAVGSDVEFQHRSQRAERIIWIGLIILLCLSMAGFFGRGPVAQAKATASDGSMAIKYERIQRLGTPSVLTIDFPSSVIQDGKIQLWISDSLIKPLGNQRVVPQPLESAVGAGGILYAFPATTAPASVEFEAQPAGVGPTKLALQVAHQAAVTLNIFVVP